MRTCSPATVFALAAASAFPLVSRAAAPVIVQNEAGFEGLEEASVIYFPGSNTFQNDPTNFPNHVDEGGSMFRTTLRNYYPTLGWWDGDRDTTNTDRQRTEAKGIVGLGHQGVDQTFEYSFDFRMNPGFFGTSHFCDVFQLKATDGNDGAPLATVALYKSGSTTIGRIDCDGDGTSGTARTFTFTAGQWIHVDLRIATCQSTESTGSVVASINGDPFSGFTNAPIFLTSSTDYRPKFGLYRGMGVSYGVPAGDSWVEHRTITGFIGASNVLTWKGSAANNTWDSSTTANFLNAANATTVFNTADSINFTDSTANTTITLAGNVSPNYIRFNANQNYTLTGSGAITGGTFRKDGAGTLTLATINSYPGLTDIRAGTLFVTGSVGNNSLVSLTGGTLKLGAANALGSSNTNGTQINGGTLDLNGFAVGAEPISVQGAGLNSAGAIINNGTNQTTALSNVTLTGDTTLGGSGRWDIRGTGASLSTGGSPFNLTKTGANQISFVAAAIDPALANITLNNGTLAFQTSTSSMGDPTKTITINPGATLDLFNTTVIMNKLLTINGGTLFAESGSGTQNTFAGPITISAAGATFTTGTTAAAPLTLTGQISTTGGGAITKNGPGTLTLSNPNNSLAALTDNAGTLNLPAPTKLTALTLAGSTDNWTPALSISTLVIQTTTANKSTMLATLQNQITYGATHATGIDAVTSLPSNQALALIDNASLATPYSIYAGLPTDINSAIITPLLLGDANADGAVTLADLNTVLQNFGTTNTNWTAGNFDNASTINLTDLACVLNNFGLQNPNASGIPISDYRVPSPAPEPGTLPLLIITALQFARRRPCL